MNLISMPSKSAHTKPAHSVLQRLRYWNTAFFAAAILLGTALLSFGHTLHGVLMLVAAAVLLRHTVLNGRARRQASVTRMRRAYYGLGSAGHAASK